MSDQQQDVEQNTYDLNTLMQDESFKKQMIDFLNKEKGDAGRQAIERFKEEQLPKILEETVSSRVEQEIEARNKKEPWQIELETERKARQKLESEIENERRQTMREKNKSVAASLLSDKGYPLDFAEPFVSDDPEKTKEQIERFVERLDNVVSKRIQDAVKGSTNGSAPPNTSESIGEVEKLKSMLTEAVKNGKTAEKLAIERKLSTLQAD